MSVGYEGEFLCVPGIHPEIQLREMNSTVKNDFDHSTILTVTGQPANISSRRFPSERLNLRERESIAHRRGDLGKAVR